jgi:hypothetical protein
MMTLLVADFANGLLNMATYINTLYFLTKHNSSMEMDSTIPTNSHNSCNTNQSLPWKPISSTNFQ